MSGRILIVESIATNRILLKSSLEAAHYSVVSCEDIIQAQEIISGGAIEVLLLDLSTDMARGCAFVRHLSARPGHKTPTIIVTLTKNTRPNRLRALRAGASEVLAKPLNRNILNARIRNILRSRNALDELQHSGNTLPKACFAEPAGAFSAPARIVVLSPQPKSLPPAISHMIRHQSDRFEVHHNTADFAGADKAPPPDLFIIDCLAVGDDTMNAADVLRLLSDLRSRSALRHAAQLLILPENAIDLAAMALDMRADDLVYEHVSQEELGHRIETLLHRKRQQDGLRARIQSGLEAAMTDPLTGLHNRRFALPHLSVMIKDATELAADLSLMILDIDHFKRVNDTYGHATGDSVLKAVAQKLMAKLLPTDMIARIGGEEFLVVMPNTSPERALKTAECLRHAVATLRFDDMGMAGGVPKNLRITISAGVAALHSIKHSADVESDLLACADSALYRAKSAGRNRIATIEGITQFAV